MTIVRIKQKPKGSTDTAIDGYVVLYAVLKLSRDIICTDPFTSKDHTVKIRGIAGFIPCYETYEEAEEDACEGRYQIIPIRIKL